MSDWNTYPSSRKSKRVGSFVFIAHESHVAPQTECVVCSSLIATHDAEQSADLFGTCDKCAIAWVYPNKTKWLDGWRPTQAEIDEYVASRPKRVVTLSF